MMLRWKVNGSLRIYAHNRLEVARKIAPLKLVSAEPAGCWHPFAGLDRGGETSELVEGSYRPKPPRPGVRPAVKQLDGPKLFGVRSSNAHLAAPRFTTLEAARRAATLADRGGKTGQGDPRPVDIVEFTETAVHPLKEAR